MPNRFGRDNRQPDERYRDPRDDRHSEDRFDDRFLRSPDQQFETSGPYRQPSSDSWNRQGFAPSPYVPRGFGGPGRYEAPRGGYSGRGPQGYKRSDERICEDVCDRLSWHDEVDATEIAVRVSDGEVILEGRVENRHMKRLAEDLADEVPGVVDVHNAIRVTKPVLTQLKEKLTGEAHEHHHANTGTKTSPASARNGVI